MRRFRRLSGSEGLGRHTSALAGTEPVAEGSEVSFGVEVVALMTSPPEREREQG